MVTDKIIWKLFVIQRKRTPPPPQCHTSLSPDVFVIWCSIRVQNCYSSRPGCAELGGFSAGSTAHYNFGYIFELNLCLHLSQPFIAVCIVSYCIFLTMIHVDCPASSVRVMRFEECWSGLFRASSGWENQLLSHPDPLRKWITFSRRVKVSHHRMGFVDLDVFGQ